MRPLRPESTGIELWTLSAMLFRGARRRGGITVSIVRQTVLLFYALLLVSCSMQPQSAAPVIDRQSLKAPTNGRYHNVIKGDTLYSIAFRTGNDYRDLAAWNNILPPYTIFVGQKLQLFEPQHRSIATSRHGPRGSQSTPRGPRVSEQTITIHRVLRPPVPEPIEDAKPLPSVPTRQLSTISDEAISPPLGVEGPGTGKDMEKIAMLPEVAEIKEAPFDNTWQWPFRGRIVRRFTESGSKGIDILGEDGQAVAAAAAGKVVYSGHGLIGYGNLVIIKHDEVFLSAYGNNKRLFVEEGDVVEGGKIIAEIGKISRTMPTLHFEIRKEGKPVNPVDYLPKN